MNANDPQPSVAKIRAGLALVTIVVVVAVVLGFVIDSGAGKAVMFAVAFTAVVRAYLLTRALRQERSSSR